MKTNFLSIIKKNFNILLNAKFSSFIFIFGPLLLILVIGAALNDTSIKNISAGVFTGNSDSFTDNFIQRLEQKSFNIVDEASLDSCKKGVVDGRTNVCINFVDLNYSSFENSSVYDIFLYVDFSQQRVVWNIIGSIQQIAETESDKVRESVVLYLNERISILEGSLNSQKGIIDLAISEISFAEISIGSAKENKAIILSSLKNAEGNLSVAKTSLIPILDLGEPYRSQALSSINSLDNSLDEIKSIILLLENEDDLEVAESSLNSLKQYLIALRSSIDEGISDLNNLKNSDIGRIANPLQVKYKSVLDDESEALGNDLKDFDYLFPSFLMFFILFSSLIYGTVSVIRERQSNAYVRNSASKVSGFSFVFGTFVTSSFVVLLQILIIVFVANFFLNISLFSNFLNLFLFLLVSIGFFSLIGLLLGFIFGSQESSIIASICISFLFFMFSSIIAPIETLPKTFSKIVSLTPFTLLETKLRLLLIFETSFRFSLNQIISLGIVLSFTLILLFVFYRVSKEKEI